MLVVRVLVVPISDRKMHRRRLNAIVIVKCHSVSSCSTIVLYSQYICGPAALLCSMLFSRLQGFVALPNISD